MTRSITQTIDTLPDGTRVVRITTEHPYDLVFIPKRPTQCGWVLTKYDVESRLHGRWLVPEFQTRGTIADSDSIAQLVECADGAKTRECPSTASTLFVVTSGDRVAYAALTETVPTDSEAALDKYVDKMSPGYFYEVKFA